jgi:hypothetical protein
VRQASGIARQRQLLKPLEARGYRPRWMSIGEGREREESLTAVMRIILDHRIGLIISCLLPDSTLAKCFWPCDASIMYTTTPRLTNRSFRLLIDASERAQIGLRSKPPFGYHIRSSRSDTPETTKNRLLGCIELVLNATVANGLPGGGGSRDFCWKAKRRHFAPQGGTGALLSTIFTSFLSIELKYV